MLVENMYPRRSELLGARETKILMLEGTLPSETVGNTEEEVDGGVFSAGRESTLETEAVSVSSLRASFCISGADIVCINVG